MCYRWSAGAIRYATAGNGRYRKLSNIELELKFVDKVKKLEEHIEHMSHTSELLYDEEYHQYIIGEYTKIINELNESDINDRDKIIFIDRITVAFKENFLDII